jgi:hypothetical protein
MEGGRCQRGFLCHLPSADVVDSGWVTGCDKLPDLQKDGQVGSSGSSSHGLQPRCAQLGKICEDICCNE